MYDVIVVGGGPAGLTAALWLGRCCRKVLVYDAGAPRNANSRGVHGFLGHDGVRSHELRRIGREEVARYGVEIRDRLVTDLRRVDGGFEVEAADGRRERGRKLLIATGLVDRLPPIEGFRAMYGTSVLPCPYCDGFEFRGRRLAAFGPGNGAAKMARTLLGWSDDVVLFTNGRNRLDRELRDSLTRNGVVLRTERIDRLEGDDGKLTCVRLANGEAVARDALFFVTGRVQRSTLPQRLGLPLNRHGAVDVGHMQATDKSGIYVCGDAAKDVQFAIVAAAEGAKAAYAIHSELLAEDRR